MGLNLNNAVGLNDLALQLAFMTANARLNGQGFAQLPPGGFGGQGGFGGDVFQPSFPFPGGFGQQPGIGFAPNQLDQFLQGILGLFSTAGPNPFAAGQPAQAPATQPAAPAQPQPPVYTIQSGDTLSALVSRFAPGMNPAEAVQKVAAANGIEDPNLIITGNTLDLSVLGVTPAQLGG